MGKPLKLIVQRHPSKLPVVIIAGDLNYPQIDGESEFASDGLGQSFLDIINDFHLHQLVTSCTRYQGNAPALLDLVITHQLIHLHFR